MIEKETNTIIYEKNSHERRAPASMTKLMTLLLIMESIDNESINLNDLVTISKNAASMGGSQIFLEENSTISVEQLIKGISIASGNDAAVAMAEHIGGSLSNFVDMMNKKASELNLKDTHFINVHGLDSENHYSSAYDMSQIARELLKHEQILNYTSLYEDYLIKPDGAKTWLVNTNKLVRFYKGVDGLKTGYTGNAGYCLTATAKRNDIRFITVIMGSATSEQRSTDTTSLLNYGFNTYKINHIVKKNEHLKEIKVHRSNDTKASIVALDDIYDLLKKGENKDYNYNYSIDKLIAPLKYGDIVGTLEVRDSNNKFIKQVDLTISQEIKRQSFFNIYIKSLKIILQGY